MLKPRNRLRREREVRRRQCRLVNLTVFPSLFFRQSIRETFTVRCIPFACVVFAVSLFVSPVFAQRASDPHDRELGWRLNYQSARDEAAANGKPLMVVIRCVP